MKQSQFLEVIDRDEAERRWREVIEVAALEPETVSLEFALGRVLVEDVRAEVDVPGFDRSNMDGFAVRAADTFGASEEEPVRLVRNAEVITTGMAPTQEVLPGTASTAGVISLPRPRAAKSRAMPAMPSASGRFGVMAISITGSFSPA